MKKRHFLDTTYGMKHTFRVGSDRLQQRWMRTNLRPLLVGDERPSLD